MSKIYNRTDDGNAALLNVSLDDPWLRHCLRLVDGKRDVATVMKLVPVGSGDALLDKLVRLGLIACKDENDSKLSRTMPPALRTSGLRPIELTSDGIPNLITSRRLEELNALVESQRAVVPASTPFPQTATQPHPQPSTAKDLIHTGAHAPILFEDADIDLLALAGLKPQTSVDLFEKTTPMSVLDTAYTAAAHAKAAENEKPSADLVYPTIRGELPVSTRKVGESTVMIRALNADPFQTAKLAIINAAHSAMLAANTRDSDTLQQQLANAKNVDELTRAARIVYSNLKSSSLFEAGQFDDVSRRQIANLRV